MVMPCLCILLSKALSLDGRGRREAPGEGGATNVMYQYASHYTSNGTLTSGTTTLCPSISARNFDGSGSMIGKVP